MTKANSKVDKAELICYNTSMINKDFADFQKYFKKYQKLLGLTGYKVYFEYKPLDSSFAEITGSQTNMVVTVRLNSNLPGKDKPHKDIRRSAMHEAIHLLLHRLESRACERYVHSDQIYEAVEEIVCKLEGLIKSR